MDLGRFFLYYGIAIQIIFCMFIFNPKLEWAVLIAIFYTVILFIFGLASEINSQQPNAFMQKFISSMPVKTIKDLINNYADFDASEYLKYLILLPSAFNLASIKLITNYDGNKKIHKSKSKLKQLDAAKLLICANVFLCAIIVLFGFPSSYIQLDMPAIPLFALAFLYLISIAELFTSVSVYISY
jgi:uncharacterized membrane protein